MAVFRIAAEFVQLIVETVGSCRSVAVAQIKEIRTIRERMRKQFSSTHLDCHRVHILRHALDRIQKFFLSADFVKLQHQESDSAGSHREIRINIIFSSAKVGRIDARVADHSISHIASSRQKIASCFDRKLLPVLASQFLSRI